MVLRETLGEVTQHYRNVLPGGALHPLVRDHANDGPAPRLFHYTCAHGAAGIVRDGRVVPNRGLVWATSLSPGFAVREWLGLTSYMLACDRMAHCFEVDPGPFRRWTPFDGPAGADRTEGAHPEVWWVATSAVRVLRRLR